MTYQNYSEGDKNKSENASWNVLSIPVKYFMLSWEIYGILSVV